MLPAPCATIEARWAHVLIPLLGPWADTAADESWTKGRVAHLSGLLDDRVVGPSS